jgi:hypothetical protein
MIGEMMKLWFNLMRAVWFCTLSSMLLVFVMIEQACIHKEHPYSSQIEECTPSRDSVLQWYFFKTGTYWVYQDPVSGQLDSCRVNYHMDTLYANGLFEFKVSVNSYLDGIGTIYYHQSIDNVSSAVSPNCELMRIWVERVSPNYIAMSSTFFYPFQSGQRIGHIADFNGVFYNGSTSIQNRFSQYPGLGNTFTNVIRLHVTGDLMNEARETIYDISKNVGIIHRSQLMPDSTWRDWNLIRYSVIQ